MPKRLDEEEKQNRERTRERGIDIRKLNQQAQTVRVLEKQELLELFTQITGLKVSVRALADSDHAKGIPISLGAGGDLESIKTKLADFRAKLAREELPGQPGARLCCYGEYGGLEIRKHNPGESQNAEQETYLPLTRTEVIEAFKQIVEKYPPAPKSSQHGMVK